MTSSGSGYRQRSLSALQKASGHGWNNGPMSSFFFSAVDALRNQYTPRAASNVSATAAATGQGLPAPAAASQMGIAPQPTMVPSVQAAQVRPMQQLAAEVKRPRGRPRKNNPNAPGLVAPTPTETVSQTANLSAPPAGVSNVPYLEGENGTLSARRVGQRRSAARYTNAQSLDPASMGTGDNVTRRGSTAAISGTHQPDGPAVAASRLESSKQLPSRSAYVANINQGLDRPAEASAGRAAASAGASRPSMFQ